MHTLRCQAANHQLQPFVRAYAEREIRGIEGIIAEPVPARLEQTLEFQFGERIDAVSGDGRRQVAPPTTVIGAHLEPGFRILLRKDVVSFGIFFQPGGLSHLFRVPMAELSGRAMHASDVLGCAISRLHVQLAECRSFSQRTAVAERFLLARAAQMTNGNGSTMGRAASRIFVAQGVVRVAQIAQEAGLSLRHFERQFLRETGVSPKTFARVARFQSALDAKLLAPHSSWLDVAHDLGYHDQMHMVHDFHDFAGDAPGKILATIRDGRPPAMANFTEL
ncbi:MAG TPA: helix-turn-helix domain-containing protein [Bryobacteraceae bacterium]|nr:helix-turn-helix domain-containing protein [Bryobacteraceae bacterium]